MEQKNLPDDDRQHEAARKLLAIITPRTPVFSMPHRRFIVGLAIGLTAVLIIIGLITSDETAESVAQALSVGTAAVALLFGYRQWHTDKRSASFDSYYSRLDLANQKFSTAELARLETSEPETSADHCYKMFVFAELDNLEYALGKFRLGFIDADLTVRAITHFLRRCCSDSRFLEAAKRLVTEGAYEQYTCKVVTEGCNIAQEIAHERARELAREQEEHAHREKGLDHGL